MLRQCDRSKMSHIFSKSKTVVFLGVVDAISGVLEIVFRV